MIERIIALIDNSGISDSAMCKELSLGNGIIGKWRKGKQKPSTEAIIKIAKYFDVTTDYLLIGKDSVASPISHDDKEWLDLIHRLPIEKRFEFKGELKGYLKYLDDKSIAPDSPQRTGNDNSGK